MLSALIDAAIIIKGDQEDPSFSFPIGVHTTQSNDNGVYLFTGAGNTSGENFTIAKLNPEATQFSPLTPEKIRFNQEKDVSNPFRNKAISLLTSISKNAGIAQTDFSPLFVTTDDLKTIYLIDMVYNDGTVSAISNTTPIFDASGSAEADGVIGLTTSNQGIVFAAVRANSESSFGVGSSGIALFGVSDSKQEGDQTVKGPFLIQNSTMPINTASPFLKIGGDLAAIENSIDVYWDSRIERLFVGLQVTGGAAGADGARSIAVGRIAQIMVGPNQFIPTVMFEPIAPSAVFDDTDKIVGAVGSDIQLSAHKVRTMQVSNNFDNRQAQNLTYLVVQGGVGTPSTTKRSVFALPLACFGSAAEIGTIAKKDSTIKDIAIGRAHPTRAAHCFDQVATMPSDVFTDANVQVKVGGGDLAVGDIDDIYVLNDTVFVSVGNADANFKPGIFYSRAILNENDAIVTWTEWQRFTSITENTFGFFTDDFTGQTGYLTGNNAASADTVKYTQWNGGSEVLSAPLLSTLSILPPDKGGIQGFFDFPQNTPGLDSEVGLLVTTGNGTIILGQSGNNESGSFCTTQGVVADNIVRYQNGTINAMPPAGTRVVAIEGGALNSIGSIVAAEIANQDNNGRLFIGGVNGLGVLVDGSGNGWGASGIGIDFEGLTADMAFKIVGNYRFIQKIISDGDFVYVLTPNKLDRIDVTMSDFTTGTLSVVTVADITQLLPSSDSGSLCDIVISEKLAILATSLGLLRVGNDANIQMATNTAEVSWTVLPVPFGVGPGYTLQAISTTGRPQDLANGAPGNLYVLTANLGNNRSRLSRFAIKDVNGSEINENTIQLLSDVYQEGVKQYFLNPGNVVQRFFTDGALVLLGMNKNLSINPGVYSTRANISIDLARSCTIVRIHKNSASGSRLIVTDTGIFTNE